MQVCGCHTFLLLILHIPVAQHFDVQGIIKYRSIYLEWIKLQWKTSIPQPQGIRGSLHTSSVSLPPTALLMQTGLLDGFGKA